MSLIDAGLTEANKSPNPGEDLRRLDAENLWSVLYERLKNQSTLLIKETCEAARLHQNRWKNRYRDISPYDNSRVFLDSLFDSDYINASYVEIPELSTRKYILTQGPMQQTASHFWLMIWEQRVPVIIMLNRVFEKGVMRCYPYFPYLTGPPSLTLEDVHLRVHLEQETEHHLFVKRIIELCHLRTNERHRVIHMHYTGWPDFGVPNSPSGLLNFLWAVRSTGTLSVPDHPAVVHCSAGVGRSGAFVLIDVALHSVESRRSLRGLDLNKLFLDLRRCRMGIIQTADQLRFCYSAVVHGANEILSVPPEDVPHMKFERLVDEVERSVGYSDSDDAWNCLEEGECDSSGDEFAKLDSISVEELEEEKTEEDSGEELEFFNQLKKDFQGTTDSRSCPFLGKHYLTTVNNFWLPPEQVANETVCMTSSIGVVRRVPSADSTPHSSCINHLVHSSSFDRSNNAVPMTVENSLFDPATPNNVTPTSGSFVPSGTVEQEPMNESLNCSPDGDSASETAEQPSERLTNGDEAESLTSEYLAVTYDWVRRRNIRRQRQIRLRERIELTRQRMRDADLERKRWLPEPISRLLRRFYVECGLIQSRYGAVIGTAVLFLATVGLARVVFNYWPI